MGYRFVDSGDRPTRQQELDKIAALQKNPNPEEPCVEEVPIERDTVLNLQACTGWASDWLNDYSTVVKQEDQFEDVAADIAEKYGKAYLLDDYNPALGGKCCPARCRPMFDDSMTEPWMTPEELFACCDTSITWEQAEQAIQYASELLYMATGRQFRGISKEIYTPNCETACDVGCGCCDYPKLRLPGPIAGVCGIYVDGVTLPLDSFRVSHDRKSLVRVDGLGWPQGNDPARDPRELIVTRKIIRAPKVSRETLACRTGETQERRLAPDCPDWVEPFLEVIGYTPDEHTAPEALSVGLCAQWAADYIAAHPELLNPAEKLRPWVADWLAETGLKVEFGFCEKCCDKYGRSCAPSGATFICSCDSSTFRPCAGAPGNANHCCSREGCRGPQPANHCQTACGCRTHVTKASDVLYAAESCGGDLLQVPDPHDKVTPGWVQDALDQQGITPELGYSPKLVTLPTYARRTPGPRLPFWVQNWVDRNGYKDVSFGHCPECLDEDGADCNGAGASYICCPHECEPAKLSPCKGTRSNPNHCCFSGGCWQDGPHPANHCQEGRCSCRAHSATGGRSRLQFSCDDGTGIKYTAYGDETTPLLTIDDPALEPKEVTGWAAEFLKENRIKLDASPSPTGRITLPTYASGNDGLWGWVDDYLNSNRGCKRLVIGYCKACAEAECNAAGATVLVCDHNHRPAPCRNLSTRSGHCCFRDSPNECVRPGGSHDPRPANHCQAGGCGCSISTNPVCPPRPAVLSSAEDQGFGLLQIADPAAEDCLEGWSSAWLAENGIDVDPNSGANIILPTFASSHNLPSWAQDWVDMTGECVNYGECPTCTDDNGQECDPVTGAVYVCNCPPPEPEPSDPCDIPEGCTAIVRTVNGRTRRYLSQSVPRHCCTMTGNECCNPDNPGPYHINCCQSGHTCTTPVLDGDCEWPPTCTVTFVCEATCEELTTKGTRFPGGACGPNRPEPCDTWEPWMYDYFGYPQPASSTTIIKSKAPRKPEPKKDWPDWLRDYFGYPPEERPMPAPCDTFPAWVNQFLNPEDQPPQICDDWVVEYLATGGRCGDTFNVRVDDTVEYEPVYVTRVLRDLEPDEKTSAELAIQEAELARWAALPCPAWEVEYLRGCLPPGAQIPIMKLACAVAKSLCGADSGCTIPFGVTELQREGVEIDMRQAWTAIQAGGTGLYEVDMWVKKINPMGLQQRVTVHRPDQCPRPRNQTLHRIR